MDSVIADIFTEMNQFHNDTYHTSLKPQDYTDYDLSLFWNCTDDEVFRRIFLFYESPYFARVKPIDGAQEALKVLSATHELHLITSRPFEIEQQSRTWLTTYFPGIFSQVHHTNQVSRNRTGASHKKSAICKHIGAQLMIDDHIDYVLDCAENGVQALLFPAPWNTKFQTTHKNIRKTKGWEEVLTWLPSTKEN